MVNIFFYNVVLLLVYFKLVKKDRIEYQNTINIGHRYTINLYINDETYY